MTALSALAAELLHRLEATVQRRLEAEGHDPPSAGSARALRALADGVERPRALATWMNVTPQAAGQAVDRLERRGWVQRRTSAGDRRAVTLALTPAGERMLAAVERCEREAELELARAVGAGRHLAARTALRDLLRSTDAPS